MSEPIWIDRECSKCNRKWRETDSPELSACICGQPSRNPIWFTWSYRMHSCITRPMNLIERIMKTIRVTSWHYCHYVYGKGPDSYREKARKTPILRVIRDAWNSWGSE
jgi:hypothetical protein